jgi:hypothetical protein
MSGKFEEGIAFSGRGNTSQKHEPAPSFPALAGINSVLGPITDPIIVPDAATTAKKLVINPITDRIIVLIKAKLDGHCAVTVTKEELLSGIHRVKGIGAQDVQRINALNETNPVDVTSSGVLFDDFTNASFVPAHILNMSVLVARNTAQLKTTVNISIKAFNEVRSDVVEKFPFAADFILDAAIRNHANGAYKGYVKILAISNHLDMISKLRAESIVKWVKSLHGEVQRLAYIADILERTRRDAFVEKLEETRVANAAAFRDAGDDEAVEDDT